jgi:hypothetical protein
VISFDNALVEPFRRSCPQRHIRKAASAKSGIDWPIDYIYPSFGNWRLILE